MLNDLDILIIGFSVMLLMAISVIAFILLYQRKVLKFKSERLKDEVEKRRAIAMASIESEEQERKRIAAELHDHVGANLSAVNLLLSSYLSSPKDILSIEEAKGLVSSSLQTIRSVAYKIHPSPLQNLGLQAAIENYLNVLTKTNRTKIECVRSQPIPRFSEAVELNAYRVVQEFVTNIFKYALPDKLICQLQYNHGNLSIILQHDGQGLLQADFDAQLKTPKGLGLQNIKYRLELHQGSCRLSRREHLFEILITIPTESL